LKHTRYLLRAVPCICIVLSSYGCGPKQPTETEKKKELIGQAGKAFDPSTIPPEYKAGFEKWQKGQSGQISAPASPAGGKQ